MQRITSQSMREVMADALDRIPTRLHRWIMADLLTEDPLFVGLHDYGDTDDGRSYRDQAHVCYPHHTPDGSVTIVMPKGNDHPLIALHEIGHVIDWRLYEQTGDEPAFEPVTAYAVTNRLEAFAEAFVAWLYEPEELERMRFPYKVDAESRAFFDTLEAMA